MQNYHKVKQYIEKVANLQFLIKCFHMISFRMTASNI